MASLVRIEDDSGVAEVRRNAMAAAGMEGFDQELVAATGIVATEAATNVRKHAGAGEVYISRLSGQDAPGIEVICIDRGPGMSNFDQCVADGYSTAGTSGTGLGAMVRLSAEFDGFSIPGKGSVIVSRIRNGRSAQAGWRFGAVCVPVRGESACGDAWAVHRNATGVRVLVADGLGHGPLAADAAKAATDSFLRSTSSSPAELIESIHRALHSTRGAAVAVAAVDSDAGKIRYSGMGNIAGQVVGGGKPQFMVSHNGTAGHSGRRIQEFEYPLPPSGLLIMHSDGLTTSWTLDAYPGLARRHPAVIAGVLYRDASRGRDDVCVVVGRHAAS